MRKLYALKQPTKEKLTIEEIEQQTKNRTALSFAEAKNVVNLQK